MTLPRLKAMLKNWKKTNKKQQGSFDDFKRDLLAANGQR